MTRINLLSWRAMRREELNRKFFIEITVTAVITLIFLFLVNFIIKNKTEAYKSRNIFLKKQIAQFDKQIDRLTTLQKQEKQILSRIKNIQILQDRY